MFSGRYIKDMVEVIFVYTSTHVPLPSIFHKNTNLSGKVTRKRPTAIPMMRIQRAQEINIMAPVVGPPHIHSGIVLPIGLFEESVCLVGLIQVSSH
jgi:hypothetical protein